MERCPSEKLVLHIEPREKRAAKEGLRLMMTCMKSGLGSEKREGQILLAGANRGNEIGITRFDTTTT